MKVIVHSLLLFTLLFVGVTNAGGVPPDITISPSNPAPMQPSELSATVEANIAALGFEFGWIDISGNSITAHFDVGCGILCPGNPTGPVRDSITVPGLPPGEYTAVVVRSDDIEVGRITFQVSEPPHLPIPVSDAAHLFALTFMLGLSGILLARQRLTPR
jgi:hypothetical protein